MLLLAQQAQHSFSRARRGEAQHVAKQHCRNNTAQQGTTKPGDEARHGTTTLKTARRSTARREAAPHSTVRRSAASAEHGADLGIEETRCLITDIITHHDTTRWVEYGRGSSLADEGTKDFVDPLVSRMPGTIGPRTRDEVATAGL